MDRQSREKHLRDVLAELRREGEPVSIPAFLEKAGLSPNSRGYLYREFPEIYAAVTRLGGRRSVTSNGARVRSENTQLRRENKRLSREAENLRTMLEAAQETAEAARSSAATLAARVEFLERCLEALVARAVEAGIDATSLDEVLSLATRQGGVKA